MILVLVLTCNFFTILSIIEGCPEWYYRDCPPGGCAPYNGQPERDYHSPCEECAFDSDYVKSLNVREQSSTEDNPCLVQKIPGQSLNLSCQVMVEEKLSNGTNGDDQQWLWWDRGEGLCRFKPEGWLDYNYDDSGVLDVLYHIEKLDYSHDATSYLCLYSHREINLCNYIGVRNVSLEVKDKELNVSSDVEKNKVQEGETVTFKCKATGFPRPDHVTWLKDNRSLEKEKYNVSERFTSAYEMQSTLTLPNVRKNNSGEYTCIGKITQVSMEDYGIAMDLTVTVYPDDSGWEIWQIAAMVSGAVVGVIIAAAIFFIVLGKYRRSKIKKPCPQCDPSLDTEPRAKIYIIHCEADSSMAEKIAKKVKKHASKYNKLVNVITLHGHNREETAGQVKLTFHLNMAVKSDRVIYILSNSLMDSGVDWDIAQSVYTEIVNTKREKVLVPVKVSHNFDKGSDKAKLMSHRCILSDNSLFFWSKLLSSAVCSLDDNFTSAPDDSSV